MAFTELRPAGESKMKKQVLRARVMDMGEMELRMALLMAVDGADLDYAIERSYLNLSMIDAAVLRALMEVIDMYYTR